jgi:tRNA 2-thiouridine synthesizing protein E
VPIEYNGKAIKLDKEGFLKNISDWEPAIAEQLASNEDIALTEAHWEILWLLRKFYQQFELSPAMRPLIKYIRQELDGDKARSIYLMQLFPGSPAKLASKIAGLPKPDNCL